MSHRTMTPSAGDVDAVIQEVRFELYRENIQGRRFCFVVPMHEFVATGPVPEYAPVPGYADHVRVFTEAELRERFGPCPDFSLHKIPGKWKPGELPECFVPVEFGSFFVAFSKM